MPNKMKVHMSGEIKTIDFVPTFHKFFRGIFDSRKSESFEILKINKTNDANEIIKNASPIELKLSFFANNQRIFAIFKANALVKERVVYLPNLTYTATFDSIPGSDIAEVVYQIEDILKDGFEKGKDFEINSKVKMNLNISTKDKVGD